MAEIDIKVAVLEEQVLSLRREIEHQAVEYQRRLSELNHAHDKQVADQATYVSSDRYEGWQGEMNGWRQQVSAKLSELEGRSGGVMTARAMVLQILPMVIALIAIMSTFWRH